MKRFLLIIVLVLASCSQVQYGDKNDVGYSYHFNSVTGDNTNLGTEEKPFKSLDFLKNINLSNGDKILSENYYQYADHFLRISIEQKERQKDKLQTTVETN